MKFRNTIITAIIAFLAIGSYVWFFVYNKQHTNYQEVTASFSGSANGLYEKAQQNQEALLQDYLNLGVEVMGVVREIDGSTIILEPNLSCKLIDGQKIVQVQGEEIKIKGRFVGVNQDLLTGEMVLDIDQCTIVEMTP